MRGFVAGHDRRQDEHIHSATVVAPLITCSRLTNAVSLQRGQRGIRRTERLDDAPDVRVISIYCRENDIDFTVSAAGQQAVP